MAFASCRVPGDHLLGGRGRGYAQFLQILDEGRIAIAALAVGLAQGCVDECLRYTGERAAFGHRLGHYQAIRFKIADMEARTHSARLAWYDAAARLVAGEPVKRQAAIAKLIASNAAMDNAREATQIFGGYGFMNEFPVGRFYRDAKVLEIGEGTSEVQRMIIARELGDPGLGTGPGPLWPKGRVRNNRCPGRRARRRERESGRPAAPIPVCVRNGRPGTRSRTRARSPGRRHQCRRRRSGGWPGAPQTLR